MAFSQKSLDFLLENYIKNDRDWYNQHREDYKQYVLEPMKELVEALTPALLKIDKEFITEPKVDRTISRIYTDARMHKNTNRYRDHCWLVFMREKKLYNGLPSFYFDFSPVGFSYGMGYYKASRESLEIVRGMILNGEDLAKRALSAYKRQKVFTLGGEDYKRPRHPERPEEERLWLNKRDLFLEAHSDDLDLLFSEDLHQLLAEDFKKLKPIYEFFSGAEDRKRRAQG